MLPLSFSEFKPLKHIPNALKDTLRGITCQLMFLSESYSITYWLEEREAMSLRTSLWTYFYVKVKTSYYQIFSYILLKLSTTGGDWDPGKILVEEDCSWWQYYLVYWGLKPFSWKIICSYTLCLELYKLPSLNIFKIKLPLGYRMDTKLHHQTTLTLR